MNKKIIVMSVLLVMSMAVLVMAAPTLITKFTVKDTSYLAEVGNIVDVIAAENVTFLCDGSPEFVTVNAHDVRTGYDDEFKDDSMFRRKCNGVIDDITDWNGNKLRTYGNKSESTIKTFDVTKGQGFDCGQKGHNWTGVECRERVIEEEEPGEIEPDV